MFYGFSTIEHNFINIFIRCGPGVFVWVGGTVDGSLGAKFQWPVYDFNL